MIEYQHWSDKERQYRKAAQEREEIRQEEEAEAEALGRCWHYRDDPPDMDPRRCENCRAGEEDDE